MGDTLERHERLTRLFLEALQLEGTERRSWIERNCADDTRLRTDLESLLDHEADATGALATGSLAAWAFDGEEPLPSRIGPYTILERLGEGGMGIVLLAEQQGPIRRRVALKLIRRGIESRSVLARFAVERQALALMSHPGIAQVFDAGVSEAGRPFFVMEHVAGEPITAYCDERRLSITQRVRLLVDVCAAVQHAHQKGVIHRDLKPSNVLVSTIDERAAPKIIDFGIAKAMDPSLSPERAQTAAGELVGTPDYMSPEQLASAGRDADTRSDVYMLGVMLYELLVGARPFSRDRSPGIPAQQDESPLPSTRVLALGDTTVAAARDCADPRSLARSLRGDLDWIAMKALAFERERRYRSAAELGQELERFLRREPVDAGPPSRIYRLRRLVSRHPAGTALVLALASVIVVASVGLAALARRLVEQSRRANENAASSAQVAGFLVDLFDSGEGKMIERSTTVEQMLSHGTRQLEQLDDQPLVQARLFLVLAQTYKSFFGEESIKYAHRAVEVLRRTVGDDHPETIDARLFVAEWSLWGASLPEAETQLQALAEDTRALDGAEDVRALRTLSLLGRLRMLQGRLEESELLLEEGLEKSRRVLGDEHPVTLATINFLGGLWLELDELERGERLLTEALPTLRRVEGTWGQTLVALYNLGCYAARAGETDRALVYLRESIDAGFWYGRRTPEGRVKGGYEGILSDVHLAALRDDPRFLAIVGPQGSATQFELACHCAARGDVVQSKKHLERALAAGFSDASRLATKGCFYPYRNDPEFRSMLDGLRQGQPAKPGPRSWPAG